MNRAARLGPISLILLLAAASCTTRTDDAAGPPSSVDQAGRIDDQVDLGVSTTPRTEEAPSLDAAAEAEPTDEAPPPAAAPEPTEPAAPVADTAPAAETAPPPDPAAAGPGMLDAANLTATHGVPAHVAAELAAVEGLADAGSGVAVIDAPTQTLWVVARDGAVADYRVSTGKGGISARAGSSGTPPGRHRVGWIVSGNVGEILRGGWRTRRTATIDGATAYMTTRALGLQGLEDRNRNSTWRGIFLHGTNKPAQLGKPASSGCIRVADQDVIVIADQLGVGAVISILA